MGDGPDPMSLAGAGRAVASRSKALVFPPVEEQARAWAAPSRTWWGWRVTSPRSTRACAPRPARPRGSAACAHPGLGPPPDPMAALMLLGSTGRYVALVHDGAGAPLTLEWALGERRGTMLGQASPTGEAHLEIEVDAEGVLQAFVGTGKDRRAIGEPLDLGPEWQEQFGEVPRAAFGCIEGTCRVEGFSYSVRQRAPSGPAPVAPVPGAVAKTVAATPVPAKAVTPKKVTPPPPPPKKPPVKARPRPKGGQAALADTTRCATDSPAAGRCGPARGIALSLRASMRTFRSGLAAARPRRRPHRLPAPLLLSVTPHVLESAAERAQKGSRRGAHARARGLPRVPGAGGRRSWRSSRFDAAVAEGPGGPVRADGQHLLARRAWPHGPGARPPRWSWRRARPRTRWRCPPRATCWTRWAPRPRWTTTSSRARDGRSAAGAAGEAAQLLRGARWPCSSCAGTRRRRPPALQRRGRRQRGDARGPLLALPRARVRRAHPPEKDGSLAGPFTGAFGPLPPRTLRAPDGRLGLGGEPGESDVYLLAFDAEVPEGGVVRGALRERHVRIKVLLDGAPLFERRAFEPRRVHRHRRAVRLPPGKHRFLVKLSQGGASGDALLHPAARGRPPVGRALHRRHRARARRGAGGSLRRRGAGRLPHARTSRPRWRERREGCSPASSRCGTAWGGTRRRAAAAGGPGGGHHTPALLTLRAELASRDRTVPTKVARGRATRDLEAVLAKDPRNVSALLLRAELALQRQPAGRGAWRR